MDTTTYRKELKQLNIIDKKTNTLVSNVIVNAFAVIKKIITLSNRGKGYLAYMSRNKNPLDTLDVLNVLKCVIEDNIYLLNTTYHLLCNNICKYIDLINIELDNVIRSDPNIIYDEDETDEEILPEININCDMISELFALISELLSSLSE